MIIREATIKDLSEASALSTQVFNEMVAPLYDREGVAVFLEYASESSWTARHQQGHSTWIAIKEGRIMGVIHVRNSNHISMLFVRSDFQHQGVACSLLRSVVNDLSVGELTVNSSPKQ